jgi:hypothetical protein
MSETGKDEDREVPIGREHKIHCRRGEKLKGPSVPRKRGGGRTAAGNIQVFKLVDLEVNPDNPRAIDPAALEGLEKSIKAFGLVQPLVVNIHGGAKRIVSGHQRYQLLLKNGVRRAACVVVDLPPAKADLLAITMNNPNIQGQFVDIEARIKTLQASLAADDTALTDLRIEELQGKIQTAAAGSIETVELKPYRKVHILLSMPVDAFAAVQESVAAILAENPEVGYEQAAN